MPTEATTPDRRRLVLIDGHANVFKAYFAIKAALTNSRGEPTHAIHGFLTTFLRLRRQVGLDHVVVVFDAHAPSFRHLAYEPYKATRRETPADLHQQVDRIREVLLAMRVPVMEAPGFEADDLLATLALEALRQGGEALVCSVDKDILQVVRPGVTVWREHLGKSEELDDAGVVGRTGVRPAQVPDYLALVGDSSDNLDGVPGVGPKTAAELLGQFGTLEGIFSSLDRIAPSKKKLIENLKAYQDTAMRMRELTRLRTDVPNTFSWESARWVFEPSNELRRLLVDLELGRLLQDLSVPAPTVSAPPEPPRPAPPVVHSPVHPTPRRVAMPEPDGQTSLFGDEEAAPASEPTEAGVSRSQTHYAIIRTREELDAVVASIRAAGLAAIDTETTGFDPFLARLTGISLSWDVHQGVYIPVGHNDGTPQLPLDVVREALDPLLADPAIRWTAHHWKFDFKMLAAAGFAVRAIANDTLLDAWLLQPDKPRDVSHGLKALAQDRLGLQVTEISSLLGEGKVQRTMAEVPVETAAPYAAQDTDLTLQLHHYFSPQVAAHGLDRVLRDVELPLTPVLARMELEGIRIDTDYFRALSTETGARLQALSAAVFEAAGFEFNINSPKQVGEVLFDRLGIPYPGKRLASGAYSTDVSVLEQIAEAHTLPGRLLEYRHLEKLRGTYIDALPKAVHPRTGRVHTSFNQAEAATGRLSSSDPNLQNIPVRSDDGQRVRRGFVARQAGWKLVAADYSQIELRILAHISGDAALIDAFRSGGDVHTLTAARVFGVDATAVTSVMRSQAKAINFGIIYGMAAPRLARDLGIEKHEAQRFIDDYFRVYSGVRAYIEGIKESARREGAVRTLSGRRRPIPDIHARNPQVRAFAERMAMNTPIQGTSADMIKLAMIRIAARLDESGAWRSRMVLQVHDELIFDAPEEETGRLVEMVREEMAAALPLSVPVKVDAAIGDNWAEV